MDRTVAREILVDADGRVSGIRFTRYESDASPKTESDVIRAKVYVIAANPIETARLLLMSKNGGRTSNGVGNRSDLVGRHLMDHPYFVAWGLAPKKLYPYRGPLITSGIGDLCDGPFRAKRGAFRVDIGNEGWNLRGDPNMTTFDFVNGTDVSRLNSSEEALLGDKLVKKLNDMFTRQFRVGFLVEQTPDRDNRVTLSDSSRDGLGLPRPEISYNISDYTRQGIVAAHRMKNLIFERMGIDDKTREFAGENDPTRFDEQIDGKTVTLTFIGAGHIMGTCRMGTDKDWQNSVVNEFQRSQDHRNLYLVGSSTFPTGATANPTLTMAALSLRTADHILNKDLK
jgi:glucose dehydrogenase